MAGRKTRNPALTETSSANERLDRMDTKCISAHVPAAMYWKLKELAVKQKVDMKDIIAEAVNELFVRNHIPQFPIYNLTSRASHIDK